MATSDIQCAGWILHRRPYHDSSLIVDCLTGTQGRIGMVARRGRQDPLLQPFRPLQLVFKGRGELKTLVRCEPDGIAVPLAGEALYCGLYINELLIRLLHRGDAGDSLLMLYTQTLSGLCDQEDARDILLRNFEFRLLDTLGYGFSLEHDTNAMPIIEGGRYRLIPDKGLMPEARGEFSGNELLALAAGDWQPAVRRLARNLMRCALSSHLGDKPLASRELFRSYKK